MTDIEYRIRQLEDKVGVIETRLRGIEAKQAVLVAQMLIVMACLAYLILR